MVQSDRQGRPSDHPGSRVATRRAEQRSGGGGWPERGAVRLPGGTVSSGTSPGVEGGDLPTEPGQTGGNPQGGRQDPTVGNTDGEGSRCPNGVENGHRANL